MTGCVSPSSRCAKLLAKETSCVPDAVIHICDTSIQCRHLSVPYLSLRQWPPDVLESMEAFAMASVLVMHPLREEPYLRELIFLALLYSTEE